MPYSIMIDAGHGGSDPGAVYKGRREKDDNLILAMAVGKILSENGIKVLYTRTTDDYISPFERARLANEAKVDYFISFHRNSSPEVNQYNGVEVLVYDKSGVKYEMAQNIVGALGELGFREIGVQARPGLVVLRKTKMPALLIETGFINSDEDNQLYDEKQEEIAQAIAGAILGTLDQQQGEEPLYYGGRPVFSANGKTRTACCICCRKKDIQRIFCRMGNSIKCRSGLSCSWTMRSAWNSSCGMMATAP